MRLTPTVLLACILAAGSIAADPPRSAVPGADGTPGTPAALGESIGEWLAELPGHHKGPREQAVCDWITGKETPIDECGGVLGQVLTDATGLFDAVDDRDYAALQRFDGLRMWNGGYAVRVACLHAQDIHHMDAPFTAALECAETARRVMGE